jgi:hypothetical protein
LGERIAHLEEQFRLAQSKRFAPSSEKLRDRIFDEAEQIAATDHDPRCHKLSSEASVR